MNQFINSKPPAQGCHAWGLVVLYCPGRTQAVQQIAAQSGNAPGAASGRFRPTAAERRGYAHYSAAEGSLEASPAAISHVNLYFHWDLPEFNIYERR